MALNRMPPMTTAFRSGIVRRSRIGRRLSNSHVAAKMAVKNRDEVAAKMTPLRSPSSGWSRGVTFAKLSAEDSRSVWRNLQAAFRIAQIKAQIEDTRSDYDREKLAVIRVGGSTEVESSATRMPTSKPASTSC